MFALFSCVIVSIFLAFFSTVFTGAVSLCERSHNCVLFCVSIDFMIDFIMAGIFSWVTCAWGLTNLTLIIA